MSETSVPDTVRAYYDKLFQDGFLVSVHVSKWGMSTLLSKEDIDYDKAVPAIFKLGKKMLIAPERLNEFIRIESRARRYLSWNSYDFPIGEAHFVPKKKILEVLSTLSKIREDFDKLKARFIENYDQYKEDTLTKYPDLAASLRPAYPEKDSLNSRFKFSISIYEIHMPQEFGEVDIQTIIDRDNAKQEVREAMELELSSYYKESMNKLEQFTENAARLLRSQIVTMCNDVSQKIKNNEVVTKLNIKDVRDGIAHFRKLNFTDDKVIEDELDKLEQVVSGNVDYKTDQEALVVLHNTLNEVIDSALNAADLSTIPTNYFRAIKIPCHTQ